MTNPKRIIMHGIDAAMIILLPVLTAEILTGQEIHEWLGTGALILFIAHHILNSGWWKSLFKGKYTPSRTLSAVINLLLLSDMLALGISGILMSDFIFDFLSVEGGMTVSRQLHLFSSYWGFILMSAHLGMHTESFISMGRRMFKISDKNKVRTWCFRIAALAVSIYGVYAFFAQKFPSYLFLQTHFVFFDETKPTTVYFAEIIAMMILFAAMAHYLNKLLKKAENKKSKGAALKITSFAVPVLICLSATLGLIRPQQNIPWQTEQPQSTSNSTETEREETSVMSESSLNQTSNAEETTVISETPLNQAPAVNDNFLLIQGGGFDMGSPDSEPWRSDDETLHTVTVSDFYISPYEVTQKDYESVMGVNPSNFSGENLPVENITWLEAIEYCNTLSEQAGLTPVYTINGASVTWNRAANGYRLPTEAEWEYACRAGTSSPFNTESSISPEESNYYGHYPYEIENNYFSQENLSTKPGEYRQTTVAVDSFSPNAWGLYNMHGNVSEWVWDYYGEYTAETVNPTGPKTGTRRVYRGGGWNDFAKNMRCAYRAALPEGQGSFNIGIRLVRNAVSGNDSITTSETGTQSAEKKKILIAFFSWSGNTKAAAEEIHAQTGADLFEIELVNPYSTSYNTVLDQSQHDQNISARPEIKNHVESFEQYDTILLGYPNWWASIPMPIASFLEEYDFSGKTIIPFCSHGGGRFGQSLTAIAKLAPNAAMGEGLSIHYSGGSALAEDIKNWLEINGVK